MSRSHRRSGLDLGAISDYEISDFSARLQQELKNGNVDIFSPQPQLKKP
jgi:hypothetical protein